MDNVSDIVKAVPAIYAPAVAAALNTAVINVADAITAVPAMSMPGVAAAYTSYACRIAHNVADGIAAVTPRTPDTVGRTTGQDRHMDGAT
jgi:hypothetical protein